MQRDSEKGKLLYGFNFTLKFIAIQSISLHGFQKRPATIDKFMSANKSVDQGSSNSLLKAGVQVCVLQPLDVSLIHHT